MPGMFSGRVHEITTIEKCLFQTKNENPEHFLIEGERGIGKTSLIHFIRSLASGDISSEAQFNFLVVSVELKSGMTFLDIIKTIAQELKLEISRHGDLRTSAKGVFDFLTNWEIMGIKYKKNAPNIDPYQTLSDLVDQISTLLIDNKRQSEQPLDGVLILVDEAEQPSATEGLGELCKNFTEMLTKRNCNNVCIGLSGLPNLTSTLRESHESSPRLFHPLTLTALSSEDSKDVINKGLEDANKRQQETTIDQDAINYIITLSEGYPHFIQQFSYCAFDVDDDNNITIEDVAKGAYLPEGAIEQLGKKFFAYQYFNAIAADDYRKVLDTMCESLDSWVSRKEIIKNSKLSEHTVGNALKALKQRGIILANERVKGEYRLPTKSFAVWIKARSLKENAL